MAVSSDQIVAKFKQFDADGNGFIEPGELATVMRHLDAEQWTDGKIEQLLSNVDRNHDQKIEMEEFITWIFGNRNDKKGEVGKMTLLLCSPFLLTASEDCTVKVWSIETGECWQTLPGPHLGHRGPVLMAQFSPDGNSILTACEDGRARIWDVKTAEIKKRFTGHTDAVVSARYSHTGEQILTASRDGDVRLWDAQSEECLRTLSGEIEGHFCWAAWSPKDKRTLTASLDGSAAIWCLETGDKLQSFEGEHFGRLHSAMFSVDGSLVLTSSNDGTAIVWNAETAEVVRTFDASNSGVFWGEFGIRGKTLLTAGKGGASLWNIEDEDDTVETYPGSAQVASCRLSPAQNGVAMGMSDGTAQVYSKVKGKSLRTLMGHSGAVNWVSWAPPEAANWPWAPHTPLRELLSAGKDMDPSSELASLMNSTKEGRFHAS